jgi:hypothetical protein
MLEQRRGIVEPALDLRKVENTRKNNQKGFRLRQKGGDSMSFELRDVPKIRKLDFASSRIRNAENRALEAENEPLASHLDIHGSPSSPSTPVVGRCFLGHRGAELAHGVTLRGEQRRQEGREGQRAKAWT